MPSTSTALSARLIFPTREIVEEYYLPIIYTACRTCYSEQVPDQIWDKAVGRQVADEKQQNLVRKVMDPATARRSSTSTSRLRSAASRARSRTSSSGIGPAPRSTSNRSAM